jgi:hypothetical protein
MAARSKKNRSHALNHLREADRAAHAWYRFILSFPPHLVQHYVSEFGLTAHHQLLDPFCGTGTTIVEGKKLGIPSVGIEINPMAYFAGLVKIDWTPDSTGLMNQAYQICDLTQTLIDTNDSPLRSLPDESLKLIVNNSISAVPLHKTLILLDQIKRYADPAYSHHLQLALAQAVTTSISNLHFGPEVGIGKTKDDAPVIEAWLNAVRAIATDLKHLQTLRETSATIYRADSRQILKELEPNSIHAVITSPPYPNEKDYTRTTRLESVLLGFITNRADLRALKQGLLRSNSRNVYKNDTDDRWVSKHPEIQHIAQTIEERRRQLAKTSGFERVYPRAVTLYFGGMAQHLASLRTVLCPGAQLAYVVGDQKSYLQVMIRTGELLADIAQGLGYELMGIDLFRTRLSTITQEQMREEVVLLRWPGEMPVNPYPFSDELLFPVC